MNNLQVFRIGRSVLFGIILTAMAGVAFADTADPMTPDVAAKAERTKRQQAERITSAKRKAAAEALKAQRKRLHDIRQGAPQLSQDSVGDTHQNSQGSKHE